MRDHILPYFQKRKRKQSNWIKKNIQPEHLSKSNHLDVFSYVLEVVFTVLHGHLVVVLALRDVGHLCLGFVLQQ